MKKDEMENMIRGWPVPAHDMFRQCLELEPMRIEVVLGAKQEYALAMAAAMSVLGRGKVSLLPVGGNENLISPIMLAATVYALGSYMAVAGGGIMSLETVCISGKSLSKELLSSLLPRISHGGIIWLVDFEPDKCADGVKMLESCCGLPAARDSRNYKYRMYVKL